MPVFVDAAPSPTDSTDGLATIPVRAAVALRIDTAQSPQPGDSASPPAKSIVPLEKSEMLSPRTVLAALKGAGGVPALGSPSHASLQLPTAALQIGGGGAFTPSTSRSASRNAHSPSLTDNNSAEVVGGGASLPNSGTLAPQSAVPSPSAGLFQAYQASKCGPPPLVTVAPAIVSGASGVASTAMRPRPQFNHALSLPLLPDDADFSNVRQLPDHPIAFSGVSSALALPLSRSSSLESVSSSSSSSCSRPGALDSFAPAARLPADFRCDFDFSYDDVRGLAERYLAAKDSGSVPGWMALWADDPAPAGCATPPSFGHSPDPEPAAPVQLISPAVVRLWSIRDGHLSGRLALRKHAEKEFAAQAAAAAGPAGAASSRGFPSCSFVALLAGASERHWTLLYTRSTAATAMAAPTGNKDASESAAAAAAAALISSAQLVSELWELSAAGKLQLVRVCEAQTNGARARA